MSKWQCFFDIFSNGRLGDVGALLLLALDEELVQVGSDTTSGDGDLTNELVQLLIILDSELDVAGDNTGLLVFAGAISRQLEKFGHQIFDDRRGEDGRADTETRGVTALAQKLGDTGDGEGQTGLGRSAFAGLLDLLADLSAANFAAAELSTGELAAAFAAAELSASELSASELAAAEFTTTDFSAFSTRHDVSL